MRQVKSSTNVAVLQEQLASISRLLHVRTVLAEIRALRAIQAEVAAVAPAKPPMPVLTVSAGRHPKAVKPYQVAAFRRSHEQIAASGPAPHSRHQRMEGAEHMSMLNDPAQAAIVSKLILDFARDITPR